MTDTLRTRIAAVLVGGGCPCFDCTAVALEKADAVIRELNLDVSVRYPTSCGTEVCVEGYYTEWIGGTKR